MKHITTALFSLLLLPAAALAKAEPSSLSILSEAEKSYYEQIFAYTMDNIQAGQKYEWKTHSGAGIIHVSDVFTSKSGVPCRNYSETFNVQNRAGAYQGVACKRQGTEGWCRLKPGNAHTCAMEDRSYLFSMPSMTVPGSNIGAVGSPVGGGTGGGGGGDESGANTPNIDTPNAPKGEVTAQDYANGVTGNAGKAAGSAASNGLSWFTKTFGR
ncbi:MAG: hypothetical protein EBV03_03215 [Proteobacteria bacterium]|nr:hypothetical protein [Pseudomonadota bacterium]